VKEKVLYIIRGLPGSGKSTLANELTPWVCEADNFFLTSNGEYKFDAEKLPEAHARCKMMCEAYMKFEYARIAVSNTSSQHWEFEPYIKLAQMYGYRITEITLTGDTYGSVHNVPDEAVLRMKGRWQV